MSNRSLYLNVDLTFPKNVDLIFAYYIRTNNSAKNKNKSQVNLLSYFESIAKEYSLEIDTQTLDTNHRSIKDICDFSNLLYENENWPKTQSDFLSSEESHLGVFLVDTQHVNEYLNKYNPVQLRDKITVPVNEKFSVYNFGKSKGLTLHRVLIYPTDTMMDWLFKGKVLQDGTRCKFYVAITRARYSVGIVLKQKYAKFRTSLPIWVPDY